MRLEYSLSAKFPTDRLRRRTSNFNSRHRDEEEIELYIVKLKQHAGDARWPLTKGYARARAFAKYDLKIHTKKNETGLNLGDLNILHSDVSFTSIPHGRNGESYDSCSRVSTIFDLR